MQWWGHAFFFLTGVWVCTFEVWRRKVAQERRACSKRMSASSRSTKATSWTRHLASECNTGCVCGSWMPKKILWDQFKSCKSILESKINVAVSTIFQMYPITYNTVLEFSLFDFLIKIKKMYTSIVRNSRNVSADIFYVLRSMERQNWPPRSTLHVQSSLMQGSNSYLFKRSVHPKKKKNVYLWCFLSFLTKNVFNVIVNKNKLK